LGIFLLIGKEVRLMGITSWGGAIPQTAAEVASLQTAAKSLSRNREMNYDFF
jgi:hypothetical protein